ncbi:MAG: Ig-like domain-containing protein, partial [Gemmatimonas sp.]
MLRPTRQHVYPVLLASVFALGCDASTSPPAAPADLVGAATLIPAGSTGGYAILSLPVGGTESLADQTQSTKTLRRLSRTTSYASADRNVATVTSRGLVTGVSNGGTLVTATAGTLVDTVIVKVGTGPSALNFSIDTVRFREIGIQSTVAPTDARYKPVFTSLDPAIASVTTTGTITSVANGNTTV